MLSLIIPARRAERSLAATVASVLANGSPRIVVVIDGENDPTEPVARSIPHAGSASHQMISTIIGLEGKQRLSRLLEPIKGKWTWPRQPTPPN